MNFGQVLNLRLVIITCLTEKLFQGATELSAIEENATKWHKTDKVCHNSEFSVNKMLSHLHHYTALFSRLDPPAHNHHHCEDTSVDNIDNSFRQLFR